MFDYRKQLTTECKNPNCGRVFCRPHHSSKVIEQIATLLSDYTDIFDCHKIENIDSGSIIRTSNNKTLDLYFYMLQRIKPGNSMANSSSACFTTRKAKSQATKVGERKKGKRPVLIQKDEPIDMIDHSFCMLLENEPDQANAYLLVGVIHLFLLKFNKCKNFTVALIIVRLFTTIPKECSLDCSYYAYLAVLYRYIQNRLSLSKRGAPATESDSCKFRKCLFYGSFSRADFLHSLRTVSMLLNCSASTDVREDEKIRQLLEITAALFAVNESFSYVNYETFYLHGFCRKLNLKSEFKFYRLKAATALNYHFILPVDSKAEILKLANSEAMKYSLQDSFFRSLFDGITSPYLFLTVGRKAVCDDTMRLLRDIGADEFRKQLRIKFTGEDGVDSGGIRKEYFNIISQELPKDKDLFTAKNNRIWFRKGADRVKLNLVGKIVGLALYNDVVLSLSFPLIVFKKLLRVPLTFEDLAEIEPDHYQSIINLEKCSSKEIKELDLLFTMDISENGIQTIKELVPSGRSIRVTKENFPVFKEAYSDFYMGKYIEEEFEAFMDGFYTIIRPESVSVLHPSELEKIVIGLEEFDFEAIRGSAEYNGYNRNSQIIKDFWSIFENYSIAQKKKLLQFITGSDRLPASGSSSVKMVIVRNGCDTERLPSSQTCFNTLLLPEYDSKLKLARKLNKAIRMTAGFFLI